MIRKIVFTGGHHNAALEVAKRILDLYPDTKVVWYGHKHATITDTSISAEYKEVTEAGIEFREVKAGKVYKTYNPIHWLRLPLGFFQSFKYIWKDKPDLIVSFGGYLAVPVVLAGWLQGVRSVTHEQTYVAGLANRLIGLFSKKVFITWPSSAKYFNPKKTVLTGLPLRQSIFKNDAKQFVFNNALPVVYVTGGKQGSHIINMVVKDGLSELLKISNVVHQTGSSTQFNDFDNLEKIKESLSADIKDRYVLRKYVFENEIGSIFNRSDIVVSRSGAHTIYELVALSKPGILIPIPWSSHNEQYENAKMLQDKGLVKLLPQNELSDTTLVDAVKDIILNLQKYKKAGQDIKGLIQDDAVNLIVAEILKLIQ